METCDDEFVAAAKDFIKRQNKAGKPWFVWLNTTHMHFITHTKPKSYRQAGRWQSPYHDTMIDHDKNVGEMLDHLTRLRLPKLFNLRTDPYEFANTTSNEYWDWVINRGAIVLSASAMAAKFAETFKEFPAVQKPNSFTVDDALTKMSEVASGSG
jgi:hypothetical protein